MCNLYSVTTNQDAIRRLFGVERDETGNLQAMPGIFPDYEAPIIRLAEDRGRELRLARWGLPSSRKVVLEAAGARADKLRAKGKPVDFAELLRMEPDSGVTNVRNTSSRHWQPWLGPAHRCLVPFTSFSEYSRLDGGDIWFTRDPTRPLAAFAGLFLPGWSGVRKIKRGWECIDLFAFLTTEPSEPVRSIHPKAMPVILRERSEFDLWLQAPWSEASALQKAVPDGDLVIVARGVKADGPGESA